VKTRRKPAQGREIVPGIEPADEYKGCRAWAVKTGRRADSGGLASKNSPTASLNSSWGVGSAANPAAARDSTKAAYRKRKVFIGGFGGLRRTEEDAILYRPSP
jgi:hypothetical protein